MSIVDVRRADAWRTGKICLLLASLASASCTAQAPTREAAPGTEQTTALDQGGTGTAHKGAEGQMGDPSKAKADADKNAKLRASIESGNYGAVGSLAGALPASASAKSGGGKGYPIGGPGMEKDGDHGGGGGMLAIPRLDPNARYATTYRPGGAALSAFDAALSKGTISASYKDLVGDFGGRYAPEMTKPTDAAMAFTVETERSALAPSGGFVGLRIAMRSNDVMPTRAQLSVHLVLDVSGSMQGIAIENAKKAAATLVEKLDANDDFSMITFSSDAQVLVPDGLIGARRSTVLAKIKEVKADGGTNISAGLDLAYLQAHGKSIDPDAVKIVMLLSDGHANGGDTNMTTLTDRSSKAFQDGIQTSTFGLGDDFDATLMGTIADKGAGGYYYLSDSTQIANALTKELDARLQPVAQAVEVRVRLRPDVIPTKVFGSHALDGAEAALVRATEVAVDDQVKKKDKIAKDRDKDAEGGMRFFMPAFARDDRHAMMLTLHVPAGLGERPIASIEIRYKDRLRKKNVTEEIPLKIKYAPSEAESAKSANPSVVATLQAFTAGDAILRAAALVDAGDRAGAAKLLDERAGLLRVAAKTLSESKLEDDAARLTRLSGAVVGGAAVSENLALAVMLRGSAYGYLR